MSLSERVGGTGLPAGFADLPEQIYADDPMWIPSPLAVIERAFSAHNPWFAQGESLAVCEVGCARAAGFVSHARVAGEPRAAFVGYWESVGDASAEAAVVARIQAWARSKGAGVLFGPIDFSTYGNYRLRTFAEPGAVTFPGEPYNPENYPEQFAALGFEPHIGYVSESGPTAPNRERTLDAAIDSFVADGFRFEPLTTELWCSRLPELHALVDQIFGQNFAYTPLSWPAFEIACGESFVRKACPVSSVMAIDAGGGLAGFVLAYPHYGPLVCQMAGDARVDVAELAYAEHMPLLQGRGGVSGILKTAGVAKQYRQRGLFNTMVDLCRANGAALYSEWCGALMREDNPSRKYAPRMSRVTRRYTLYRKLL